MHRLENLRLDPPLKEREVVLYGTCQAQDMARACQELGWKADHIMFNSYLSDDIICPSEFRYECAIFALNLRAFFHMSGHRLLNIHDTDFSYYKCDASQFEKECHNIVNEYLQKISDSIKHPVPKFFLSFIEPPVSSSGIINPDRNRGAYRIIRSLNDAFSELVHNFVGMYYVEVNDILRLMGDNDAYVGYTEWFAHNQTSLDVYRSIAKRIDKCLSVINQEVQPVKLIITDLDDTLWIGVAAEKDDVGPGLAEGWPIGYAEALLECKRRGLMLAICSKNDENLTRENFKKIWVDRLSLEDFVSLRINWRPKSENVAEILQEVNVLPENTLFIDDNPLEIAEVTRVFPQMRFLTGEQWEWRKELLWSVPCQVPRISAESARRTELLQAKIQRERAFALGDRESYLRELGLRATIWRITEQNADFERAFELINKTNQFNTTGERWSLGDFLAFMERGGAVFAMRAQDRLAHHGLISVALLEGSLLRQMVLSCRVFGLNLEDAFLHRLCAELAPGETLRAAFRETERNATAREFIRRLFEPRGEEWGLPAPPAWPAHIGSD
jgi:FkbH-like protein